MKKLKKLSLKKEGIINLNDFEMNASKGGTTPAISIIQSIIETAAATAVIGSAVYGSGQAISFWDCYPPYNPDNMSDISNKNVWHTNVQYCELPELVVYAM